MNILKYSLVLSLCLFFASVLKAQEQEVMLKTKNGNISGSLLVPEKEQRPAVVLIISGSGPTDRNGNQQGRENNSLKLLADSLGARGIASLRFDKRGLAESRIEGMSEASLRFEDYVTDVKGWIDLLSADKRFSKLVVAGHSEGALIGLIASEDNKKVDGYISIAGAARPADEMIKEQLSLQPEQIKELVYPMLDTLKKGDTLTNVPQFLYTLFRPGVQPYLISWFRYDPRTEIARLKIPVLIIQGTTDIQVLEKDAEMLGKANPAATVKMIRDMNHILKEFPSTDRQKQVVTYSNPDMPLHKELINAVTPFINGLK